MIQYKFNHILLLNSSWNKWELYNLILHNGKTIWEQEFMMDNWINIKKLVLLKYNSFVKNMNYYLKDLKQQNKIEDGNYIRN
jgi:hypothetical protein